MPIRHDRDDVLRRVVVRIEGPFQTGDVMAFLEQHRLSDAWSYGMLYDLRGMTGQPTLEEQRALMSRGVQAGRQRGPLAILVTDPEMYKKACAYAALGHAMLTIGVFRDAGEAEAWLAGQSA